MIQKRQDFLQDCLQKASPPGEICKYYQCKWQKGSQVAGENLDHKMAWASDMYHNNITEKVNYFFKWTFQT